jgi:succinyl-CoA synthetase alpha subunit
LAFNPEPLKVCSHYGDRTFTQLTYAVTGMLDFDYCCGREDPSVAGMIYPFSGNHSQKFYWGSKEILIPVFQKMEEAVARHPEVDVLINFASFRSAYDSTMAALEFPQVRGRDGAWTTSYVLITCCRSR